MDYWHQYALRIAIRQLSSHLAPSHAQYRLSAEQQRQHLVLLSSLSSLLTRQPTLYVTPPYSRPSRCVPSSHGHLPALWLARVQGSAPVPLSPPEFTVSLFVRVLIRVVWATHERLYNYVN
ncbi:hypothetical protein N4G58_17390 [Edwardsiella piscicida]|nr:hypothetical protein N4G58_17390 [Edwardsiella piscicida]